MSLSHSAWQISLIAVQALWATTLGAAGTGIGGSDATHGLGGGAWTIKSIFD